MVDPVFGARLALQGVTLPSQRRAGAVVGGMLAIQSQDFTPGMWSIAQRMEPAPTLAEIGDAFDRGDFLRTHVLRPTWHYVTPADIAWLIDLTGPRVRASNKSAWPKLGLSDAVVHQAAEVIALHLEQGPATRAELVAQLTAQGLPAAGVPLAHILMWPELTGAICSGPRRGKEQTYALVAHRAPGAVALERDAALAELVVRYVAGHAPTTLKDLRFWASLPLRDLQVGLELAGERVARVPLGDQEYLVAPGWEPPVPGAAPPVALLQVFDELAVGYSQTRQVMDPRGAASGGPPPAFLYANPVVVRGELAGWWRRTERARAMDLHVALAPGVPLTKALRQDVAVQHVRLSQFYGKEPGALELMAP